MQRNSRDKIYTSKQATDKVLLLFLDVKNASRKVSPSFLEAGNQQGRYNASS